MSAQEIEIANEGELQPGDVIVRAYEPGPPHLPTLVRREMPAALPSVPGYYAAAEEVVELLADGVWFDGEETLDEEEVRDLGPLQRLVLAAGILDTVRQSVSFLDRLDGDAKAAVFAVLDDIAASYGATP